MTEPYTMVISGSQPLALAFFLGLGLLAAARFIGYIARHV